MLNIMNLPSRALLLTARPIANIDNAEVSKHLTSLRQLGRKCSALALKGWPWRTPATRLRGHPEVPRVAGFITPGKPGRAQGVSHAGFHMYVDL